MEQENKGATREDQFGMLIGKNAISYLQVNTSLQERKLFIESIRRY